MDVLTINTVKQSKVVDAFGEYELKKLEVPKKQK